jgi:hypothetical protein
MHRSELHEECKHLIEVIEDREELLNSDMNLSESEIRARVSQKGRERREEKNK